MTVGRRVVVTGVGLVSPVAIGTEANWDALLAGKSGIRTITRFDASHHSARIAGEVEGFDPLNFVEKKDVKKMDVFIQYAIAAAQFAVDDAHLKVTPEIADNVGVFIASGIGGFSTIEREHIEMIKGGPRRISPFFIPASIINLAAGQVSNRVGARDRRGVRDHPARRRGDHDCRRLRIGDHAARRRRVRRDARAVDAQ
jgi:3-oxoacyl-[acyl-carrier-protein] synthase II